MKRIPNKKYQKINTYVVNDSFYDHSAFDLWHESGRYKRLANVAPIYSVAAKFSKLDFIWNFYNNGSPCDSVEEMAARIFIW